MKKQLLTLAVAGVMSVGAVFGAAAAGVGYVNTGALFQAHPKMAKAELTMRTEVQQKQQQFEKEAAKLKDDAAKQQLAVKIQNELTQKERSVMEPIQRDIINAIEKTRKQKDLDIIIDQGVVIAGGQDVTVDVQKNL